MFGNTAAVGRAVADGLRLEGVEVEVADVRETPVRVSEGLSLLVLGAPTHAFSLSRPRTRMDAVRQGAPAMVASLGLREWLGRVRAGEVRPRVAVFDTRVTKVRWLPRAAAPTAFRMARRRRFPTLGAPVAFLVEAVAGPLVDGELDRALAWGRTLGTAVADSTSRPTQVSSVRGR
jgi:hypothetical protein